MNKNPFEKQTPRNKIEKLDAKIKVAGEVDWERFKNIIIESLKEDQITDYLQLAKNPKKRIEENQKINGLQLVENAEKRTEEEWRRSLSPSDARFTVLAEIDSSVTGVISEASAINMEESLKERCWHVIGVFTRFVFRRQGLALKVFEKIIEEVKAKGGTKITLNVRKGDEKKAARKMYAKLGFEIVEEINDEKGNGGYYSMSKDLVVPSNK